MKTIQLNGTARTETGKAAMKKIRRAGMIPAVVYGQGEPTPVSVDYQGMEKILHSPETFIVNLEIDGKTTTAIVRESQFHAVNDRVIHVDFLRVSDSHPVEVDLPIKLVGTSKGVLGGGRLVPMLRKMKVKGLVSQLPDHVDVDISGLEMGKTIRVGEVTLPGINITSPHSAGIAIIEIPRAVRQAEEAAAAASGKK
jgi:large subunit ribosomal protein L25